MTGPAKAPVCAHGDRLTYAMLRLRWRERDHGICRTTPDGRCPACGRVLIKIETAAEVLEALGVRKSTTAGR